MIEWIADSWKPLSPEDDEDEDLLAIDEENADDAIDAEALSKEQSIRSIVAGCINDELEAESIRISAVGLCRSLGAIAQLAVEESQHKQTCMEAAGVIAVTTSCERMLRSVSGFKLIRNYRFSKSSEDSD